MNTFDALSDGEILKLDPNRDEIGRSRSVTDMMAITRRQQEILFNNQKTITHASLEVRENPEREKMRAVVEEAVSLHLVREEVFPAVQVSAKEPAYLLSSSHPATDHQHDKESMGDVIQTQVELFQFVHLMHRHGMTTPIHVEGRKVGKSYTAFPIVRPIMAINGKNRDIHDPDTQAFLFEHPDVLQRLIHEYMDIAAQHNTSAPIFYAFTSYPHITGAHGKVAEQKMHEFTSVWLPFHHQFDEKYRPLLIDNNKVRNSTNEIETKIQTGWDDKGIPVIGIGGQWQYCDVIITEFQGYLDYADKFAEIDAIREQDLAEIFTKKSPGQIPMGFYGKGHEFAIINLLKHNRETRVITPTSSIQEDDMRRNTPINDPASKLLWIDLAQKVIAAARWQSTQPKPH